MMRSPPCWTAPTTITLWVQEYNDNDPCYYNCVLTDPYHHGLVVGSTGCGKTASAVEPYLREALWSGHGGAVYDYKSQALEGRLHFGASRARPRAGRLMPAIRTLNMVDTRYSHRFDLLSTIRTPLHAQELAGTIITGGRTHRDSSDFFNQAAPGYLPPFCTTTP